MSHFTEENRFDNPFFWWNRFSLPLFFRPFHAFFTSSLVSRFFDSFFFLSWLLSCLFALDLCRSIITIQCWCVEILANRKETQNKICSTHSRGERERTRVDVFSCKRQCTDCTIAQQQQPPPEMCKWESIRMEWKTQSKQSAWASERASHQQCWSVYWIKSFINNHCQCMCVCAWMSA